MNLRFISPLLILALVAGRQAATAQACRDASADEKAVLDKAQAVLSAQIAAPLRQAGWVVEESNATISIAKHTLPYRPMMLCAPYFTFKLKLDPATPMGKKMQDSAAYYFQQMNDEKDPAKQRAAVANLNRVERSSEVTIRVDENHPYLKERKISDEEETVVNVGNWAGVDMRSTGYVPYPFVHRQAGPWLETLRFRIIAPEPVAEAIIKRVDWRAVEGALTK